MSRPRPLALLAVVGALLLGACGGGTSSGGAASSGAATSGGGTVTVLAAASLTKPLTALAKTYEADHPGTTLRLSFGSSTTLAQQIAQGAQADLFVSAGKTALDQLGDVKPTAQTTVARNTLEIATPDANPGRVAALADLARSDVDVVLCVATAPCGKAADEVLGKAGVTAHVVSREVDVAATLAKVALGEADAAVVYHSDVVSSKGKVLGVEIPAAQNTTLSYPLLRFGSSTAAAGFADFVSGSEGLKVLEDAGFLAP